MPIRDTLIEQEARKQVVVLDDAQTLRSAAALFTERSYAENEAYLVVAMTDNSYRAMSFGQIGTMMGEVGWGQTDAPLADLPIPEAYEVVDRASESSGAFIQRVRNNPGKTFIVVDGENFAALFFNPNLSDTGVSIPGVQQIGAQPLSTGAETIPLVHTVSATESHPGSYVKRADNRYTCQTCGERFRPS